MKLALYLLRILNDAPGSLFNENYLFNTANIDLPEAVTLTEIRVALKELESLKQIVSVRDEDRGTASNPFVYQITSAGKARAAK